MAHIKGNEYWSTNQNGSPNINQNKKKGKNGIKM